jgi:putative DNA primase/helicase
MSTVQNEFTDDPQEETEFFEHFSDMGNAERFYRLVGEDVHYCDTEKQWYVWVGKRWKKDATREIWKRATDTIRLMYLEAGNEESDGRRKKLASHALKSESHAALRGMIELAKGMGDIPIDKKRFDTDVWLLNCPNGTVDLKTGELCAHDRNDLITRMVRVEYNPDALCPRWEAFIDWMFAGNQELITFLQRVLGYTLTGSAKAQNFFLLHGEGDNGKSTLLEIVLWLMWEYAQAAEFNTFLVRKNETIRNDVKRMEKKRLVVAKEPKENGRLDISLIKELTGGDSVTARGLYKEYDEEGFMGTAKLFFAANHKPQIRDDGHATWRRVRLIPFTVKIEPEKKNENLREELQAEGEGILAWMVRGCLDWQKYGLAVPEPVRKATEEYRKESNNIIQFVEEACWRGEGGKIKAGALYGAYRKWCEGNHQFPIENSTVFGKTMTEMGIRKSPTKTREGIFYYDIDVSDVEMLVTPASSNGHNPHDERMERIREAAKKGASSMMGATKPPVESPNGVEEKREAPHSPLFD